MKFASMLNRLRNTQGGMGSTSSSPYANCPYLPSMTEPPWLTEARRYLVPSNFSTYRGEFPTSNDNEATPGGPDRIEGWAATVLGVNVDNLGYDVTMDGWCTAFVGAVLAKSNLAHTGSLSAASYVNPDSPTGGWGRECGEHVGAIAVFNGHVGFVSSTGMVLGGNQSDAVTIQPQSWYGPVLSYRWPSECPCPGEASGQNSP